MFTNLRISVRLAIGIAFTLIAVVLLMLPAVLGQLGDVVQRAEDRQLEDLHSTLQAKIDDSSRYALMTALTAVSAPGVTEAFAAQDRAHLQALTLPVFEALKKEYNVRQFQFHLPPATSFIRLHQLEKFGDDLSSFRSTVVKANETNRSQNGLENGVAGIGLRGVIAVSNAGKHIGSAEMGLSFGQDFFDNFTKQYKAPVALHVAHVSAPGAPPSGDFKVFATTIPGESTIDHHRLAEVMAGDKPYTAQANLEDRSWSVMARPVLDFSGKPVGVAEILIDRTDYENAYQTTLIRIVLIGFLALIIGLALAWLLSRSITRPIEELTAAADEISRGKFDHVLSGTERKDEIGDLARAVGRMSTSIKLAMDRIRKTS